MGDLLQHGGFAGLGRRDDQPALAQTDGGEQVDHPGGQFRAGGFQNYLFLREYGRHMFEGGAVAALDLVGFHTVDQFNAD